MKSALTSVLSLLASVVTGAQFPSLRIPLPPTGGVTFSTEAATHNISGTASFTQLLDHDDPSKGTFQQQYWWDASRWSGLGAPVVLLTPGEAAAAPYTGYLTNQTISGLFAQEINGAAIIIERKSLHIPTIIILTTA